jgi:murein DD-endopeptidase MepM/ murein hydrolase activator NlpD
MKPGRWFLTAIAGAALLTGCVRYPEPNLEPMPGEADSAAASVPGATALSSGAIHKVQPGDSVFSLAERYRVPLRSLIDINRLQPPYRLIPGQQLFIPKPREHRVAQGDTVYGISRRYRVDMSALVKLNQIVPPYTIQVGQILRVPAPIENEGTVVAATPAEAAGAALPSSPADTVPQPPQPSAGPGAGRVGVEAEQLGATEPAVPPPADPNLPAAPLPSPSVAAGSAVSQVIPPSKPATPVVAGVVPEPLPRASSRFLWPVTGKVVSSFGAKKGGLHNDGINIAAPRGAPVRAAENGIVAYAGNELRGFGNLLLIKHADGWTSAYAHNDRLLVRRGDQVRRGQIIARVGSTGSVTSPQLHFELREGSEAVDPLKLLARQQAGL